MTVKPKKGAVIRVSRLSEGKPIYHYGIFVNIVCVIHYAPIDEKYPTKNIIIHKVTLEKFLRGGEGEIVQVSKKARVFSPRGTIKRAESRLGEDKYNLALSNCEHFALWCKTGLSASTQVDNIIKGVSFVVFGLAGLAVSHVATKMSHRRQ
jgi:hypothetical protein